MNDALETIIALARQNIERNPSLQGRPAEAVAKQYLAGLRDEVEEVGVEIRADNAIYLADELADILWDYACAMAQLERAGYISNIEEVLVHAVQKYQERAPAFLELTEEKWEAIKTKQKTELKHRHQELYGN